MELELTEENVWWLPEKDFLEVFAPYGTRKQRARAAIVFQQLHSATAQLGPLYVDKPKTVNIILPGHEVARPCTLKKDSDLQGLLERSSTFGLIRADLEQGNAPLIVDLASLEDGATYCAVASTSVQCTLDNIQGRFFKARQADIAHEANEALEHLLAHKYPGLRLVGEAIKIKDQSGNIVDQFDGVLYSDISDTVVICAAQPIVKLYRDFIVWLDFINLDLSVVFSLGCIFPTNFYDKLLITTLLPLGILAALGIAYVLVLRRTRNTGRRGRLYRIFVEKAGLMVFTLTFFVFSIASTVIFQTFACDEIVGTNKSYLRADYSLECHTSTYRAYRAYALAMALFTPWAYRACTWLCYGASVMRSDVSLKALSVASRRFFSYFVGLVVQSGYTGLRSNSGNTVSALLILLNLVLLCAALAQIAIVSDFQRPLFRSLSTKMPSGPPSQDSEATAGMLSSSTYAPDSRSALETDAQQEYNTAAARDSRELSAQQLDECSQSCAAPKSSAAQKMESHNDNRWFARLSRNVSSRMGGLSTGDSFRFHAPVELPNPRRKGSMNENRRNSSGDVPPATLEPIC
ncbi:hypothetical protein JKP88DRAFT_320812 [Tribonema minus]|uniref:Uncharacterized protein n=1 Tax=Tribonema minus TaxID=303371 RepID=A0A835YX79_9STRA|nr:hypothetical protein JKP88DRAFT_320812 [Tribonema minus]